MFSIKNSRRLKRCTMFLAGLVLLQPLYLGLNAPYFTIRRFHIPESSVDLYISKLNNTMQLSYFLGTLFATLFFYYMPQTIQIKNDYISVGTNWSTVLGWVLVLFSYVVNGDEGSLTFYYYSLSICSFISGFNQGFVMKVAVAEIPWYSASIPMAGIQIVLYQLIFSTIADKFGFENVDFTIIVVQISISIILCTITSVLWTLSYLNVNNYTLIPSSYETHNSNFFKNVWMSRYPIIASCVGLGWVYFCYPAIVPYKLTDIKSAYRIDLLYICAGAFTALAICLLCEFTTLGPNKNWKQTNSYWVYSLFLIIPFLLLPALFIIPLHYPDVKVGTMILNNKYLMGFLGLIFILIHSTLVTVGYSSVAMQTNSQFNGDVAVLNVLSAYIVMLCIVIFSQGYLNFYSAVNQERELIPEDLGTIKSFFYWLKLSFVYGWRGFLSTFTSNIKKDILNA